MNQILTEVATKFSKLAYIQVQGITNRESIVRLDSISNNFDVEPGDIKKRVFRAEVTLTAESYISQPIVRRKSVLKTSVDFFDSITDSDIANIISRIDESIED